MRALIVLCLSFGTLFAEIQLSKDGEIRTRENYPITWAPSATESQVDPISGEYIEESVDLVIAGAQPLTFRRFYNSSAPHNPRYTRWRINPEYFAAGNLAWEGMERFAVVGSSGGGVTKLTPLSEKQFGCQSTDGCNRSFSGQGHPLNTKLAFANLGDPKNKRRFVMLGEIVDGTGAIRKFSTMMHAWHYHINMHVKKRNSHKQYWVYPEVWTPYQLLLREERCPNGNHIVYTYAQWESDKYYPKFMLVDSISMYNRDKTRLISKLNLAYERDRNKNIRGFLLKASDGRSVSFQYEGRGGNRHLTKCISNSAPLLQYQYDGAQKLQCKLLPEGQLLRTEYYPDGKVQRQLAPIGPNGEMVAIGEYEYHADATIVKDAMGQQVIYRLDNKRITAKEWYEGDKLFKKESMQWQESTGNLLRYSIQDGFGNELLYKEYTYDKNHNVIEERVGNRRSYETIRRSFSDDGFNLLLSETQPSGMTTNYSYLPETNLCVLEEVYDGNELKIKRSYTYDDTAVCTRMVEEEGNFCKIVTTTPKATMPCLGLPEVVEEKTLTDQGEEVLLKKVVYEYALFGKILKEHHYDALGVHCYTIENRYDEKERLIWTKGASGEVREFSYDGNDNLLTVNGRLPRQIVYDRAGRPTKVIEGDLITTYEYDLLGRVVREVAPSGFAKEYCYDRMGNLCKTTYADGKCSVQEYTILGHLSKEIDLDGYETLYTRDFRGNPLLINYPDGTYEECSYDAAGRCISKKERNNLVTNFTYDIFAHVISKKTYDRESVATYLGTLPLLVTDCMGVTTSYEYDGAGRKIAESRAGQTKRFFYDARGRLYKREEQDALYIESFDNADNVIERRVEDKEGRVLRRRTFAYDEAGNCIAEHREKGSYLKEYDAHNRLVSITDPLGYKTTYSYEPSVTYCTNPKGITTITQRDCRGNEVAHTTLNQAGEVITQCLNSFDGRGNKIEENRDDVVTRYVYGPMNRIERQIAPEQRVTSYFYDAKGHLIEVDKPSGQSYYLVYDYFGQKGHFWGEGFDYHYSYDKAGRVVRVKDKFSNTTTVKVYNELGKITYEKLANGIALHHEYDQWGRRVGTLLPDGSCIRYTYYTDRLFQVEWEDESFTYNGRDLEGHVTHLVLPKQQGSITIARDALSRWQQMSAPNVEEYFPEDAYDALGNLTNVVLTTPLGTIEQSYAYDDLNQLMLADDQESHFDSLGNYSYDLNGNLPEDRGFTLLYDGLDRLIEAKKKDLMIRYGYDEEHRRVWQSINGNMTRFIWDGADEIGAIKEGEIKELRILGEGFEAEVGSSLLFVLDKKRYIPIHDHSGNVIHLLDAATLHYSAFGKALMHEGIDFPWQFSSKRVDKETGYLYFGRRYYMPVQGRFLTADPLGYAESAKGVSNSNSG